MPALTETQGLEEITQEITRELTRVGTQASQALGTDTQKLAEELLQEAQNVISKTSAPNDKPIKSDTFTPTGRRLGYGCWGVVDEYEDLTAQKWAIKRFQPNQTAIQQMKHRGLTPEQVMRNEAISLDAANHHIVPRIIERDREGEIFVGMPVYSGSLEDRRYIFTHEQEPEKGLKIFRDLAEAIRYLHLMKGKAHGDIKPNNILLDDQDGAFLTDLGSSTCVSISSRSENPRDNIGERTYRAPECYRDDSHPDLASDVFSFGALFYSFLTEKEIYSGVDNPEAVTDKELKAKIRQAPRAYRPFLRKCLTRNPEDRFSSTEMKNELERIAKEGSAWNQIKNHTKKWTLVVSLPLAAMALAYYNVETYEPKELQMPKIEHFIRGHLNSPLKDLNKQEIVLLSEEIKDLSGPAVPDGALFDGYTKYAKASTENRNVAYMAECYRLAEEVTRGPIPQLTKHQEEIFWKVNGSEGQYRIAKSSEYWAKISSSIEYGLNQANIPGMGVDLEDSLVLARLGPKTLNLARRLSNSQDYQIYRNAKFADGEPLISKDEQKLLNTWLYYIQGDPDCLRMSRK